MASEATTPITSIQEPGLQGMPRTYTSEREVPAEYEPPVRGTVVGNILPRYKTHIVLQAEVVPRNGKRVAIISHCSPPSWNILLGSTDRKDGSGEHLYERQVVPVPTQAAIEADKDSSYEPIDETKSLRITKKPRRKKTDGTYEDGYPKKQRKSIVIDDLTPAKFKGQVVNIRTTSTEALAAGDVNNIPAPAFGSTRGDVVQIIHEKLNDDQYARTVEEEVITEGNPLEGEEYGDIVTKSVEEELVVDGTAADTGLDVTESVVDPIGNGKSIKRTKRVKGGAWPDPVEQETGKEPNSPPAKYRDYVIRTRKTRKVGSIPGSIILTGSEVGKTYKRETPDRVEESVIEEQINLDTSGVDESIERKPFVEIKTTVTPGNSPVLPATGNGSATLVYRSGNTKIYDNSKEVATARTGLKGIETKGQSWGRIEDTISYSTSPTPPAGGSSSIVFSDGSVVVYEVSSPTVVVGGGTEDRDPQQWGMIRWTGTYNTGPGGDRSRQVWSNGQVNVYLNETAEITVSGTTKDKDPQQWGSLTWDGTYATSSSGDRSRQIWRLGTNSVFLNENVTVSISGTTKDRDPQQWGSIVWEGTYAASSSGDRSRQVWRLGTNVVFLNENATVEVSGTTKDRDPQQWGSIVWNGSYSSAPSGDRYRQIWRLGDKVVFLNETAAVEVQGTTLDSDPQQWGTLTWSGTYATTPVLEPGKRSRQVWRLGDKVIYLNESPSFEINSEVFTSAKEENAILTEEQRTHYGLFPLQGNNTRSRVAFVLGNTRIYENTSIVRTPKPTRTYMGITNVSIPPEVTSFTSYSFIRKNGGTSFSWDPILIEGYTGPMAAEVSEYWVQTLTTVPVPLKFRPAPISFNTPRGGISVPPTLHPQCSFFITIGSDDPEFVPQSWNAAFPATDPPSAVGQKFLADVDAQPYRDGYVIREYRVQL